MKILITSGGTTEKIDSVRGITNHSTGKLGKTIAEEFLKNGHEVTLITTKQAVKPTATHLLTIKLVETVADLKETLKNLVPLNDVLVHAMAVSDYTPVYMTDLDNITSLESIEQFLKQQNTETKISSKADFQVLFLKKTPKIISYIKKWNPNILLIGFKLLVGVSKEELIKIAKKSLIANQADYILANDLNDISGEHHHAYLLGQSQLFEAHTKTEIAQLITEKVTQND